MANQMTTSSQNRERRNMPMMQNQNRQSGDLRSLVTQFMNFLDMPSSRSFSEMEPKIEMSEDENEVTVMAEMPGVAEEDIDVEISADGYMTISGEKRDEHEETGRNGSYFSEISYGHVSRTIPLPSDLQFDQADAEYADGLLQITIPKSEESQQRRKKISVAHNESGSRRRRSRNRSSGQNQSQAQTRQ